MCVFLVSCFSLRDQQENNKKSESYRRKGVGAPVQPGTSISSMLSGRSSNGCSIRISTAGIGSSCFCFLALLVVSCSSSFSSSSFFSCLFFFCFWEARFLFPLLALVVFDEAEVDGSGSSPRHWTR